MRGQRDARRETLDRIARRRTRWAVRRRTSVDGSCARCATVYANHDLVLSPLGRVCEACEDALEVSRAGRLHAMGGVRVAFIGSLVISAVHISFSQGHLAPWGYAWAASLAGLCGTTEGARHWIGHRRLCTTARHAGTEGPPWWGGAASVVLAFCGIASLAFAVVV